MSLGDVFRLIVVMVLWASCFPLIVIGLELAPHLLFAAERAAIAGAVLVAAALVLRRPIPHEAKTWGKIVLLGLSATSLGFLGMFHGAEFLSTGIAAVLLSTQPLAAAFLARGFLNERLGAQAVMGLAAGFAGITVASWPNLLARDAPFYLTGAAYVMSAAIGTAIGNVVMKNLSRDVDALVAVGFGLLIGAAPLAAASLATEDISFHVSPRFVLVLATLAIPGTALAAWLWFDTLKTVGLSAANVFTYLVPVLGLAFGVWFFGERLSAFELAGALLVLAGVWVAQRAGGSGSFKR
jgi:drug/metabolite transporter (DMT)-like permease